MNCSEILASAPLYLAGELEPSRAETLSKHLKDCPACRSELGQQAAFDAQLRNGILAERLDVAAIDQRISAAIRSDRRNRGWHRGITAMAAIAAVLLLAVVGYRTVIAARTKTVYAAAARDHRVEVVDGQPRKWTTDRASIEKLASLQGLAGSAITSLTPDGYHLAQGRLCFLNGRVFLHLVYRNDDGNFSLFLRSREEPAMSAASAENFTLENVAGFQKKSLTGLVVTEQSSELAAQVANSVAASL